MGRSLSMSILGRTGLEVSRLGYGTAIGKHLDEVAWGRLLNDVLDSGINFIDTANDYGVGWGLPAEGVIGRHISSRRSEFFLATKCGCPPGDGERPNWGGEHIWTRENAFRGLHESLKRLNTDYIDVMQYHNPSVEEVQEGGLVEALTDMRQEGKVRWLGISTTLPHLPTFLSWGIFDTFQIPYSALERDHENWITKSAQAGVGIIVRGGVAQGDPSAGPTATTTFGGGSEDKWRKFKEANLDDLLDENETRTSLILRYTLSHPNADTNIVGTSNPDHLKENLAAIDKGVLPEEIYSDMKIRLEAVGLKPSD